MRKNKEATSSDEAFEKMYQKFYVKNVEAFLNSIPAGREVYPAENEIQEAVKNSLSEECAFRFLYNPSEGMIEPIAKDDKLFLFSNAIHNKLFFEKFVHRSFLIPYWIYAGFAYRLAAEIKTTRAEILEAQYRVELPLRLPPEKIYAWYVQQTKVLTVDENNRVLTHINIYRLLRPFSESKFAETRMIEATILKDERLNKKFQQLLKQQLTDFFKSDVFTWAEMNVLQYYADKNPETEEKPTLPYKKNYRLDLNKIILKKMRRHTGYQFADIRNAVAYLQEIQVL